jgi:hypothetical protein
VPECGGGAALRTFILQEMGVKQGFMPPSALDSD